MTWCARLAPNVGASCWTTLTVWSLAIKEWRGTSQDPRWVKGRRTKARRFLDHQFDGGEKLSYDVAQTPLTEIIEDTLQLIDA